MSYLPVSIRLEDRAVTVVGGGQVATGRVQALLECGARVRVISPSPSGVIRELAGAGRIVLEERGYRSGDLEDSHLVMAATDDTRVNRKVWSEAREKGIWVNVADDPRHCDFIMPSILRRGDLSIAVSTSGRSPALAVRLRQRIGRMIGREYARLVEVLEEARDRVRDRVADPATRRRLLYRLVDSDLPAHVRHGNDAAVRRQIDAILDGSDAAGGMVYIVGAGPGDPGLITVRGLECLHAADVVLHDRLISPELLEAVTPGAEVIDVGKRAGDQGRMQAFIEETMIRKAREGAVVCRLKGGDPFVFGRGGEEAQRLTEEAIPFEIVPGVTSATSAPAAAGIPLTHRDIAHSFLVMTGSRARNASPGEWAGAAALLGVGGTVVVMMGLAHVESIVGRLREAGCSETIPAAVVSRGTLPDQTVWVGTLGTIASGPMPPSPGVIVFGEVVTERGKLGERRASLSGARPPKSPE
jgi:uroporphyrin-III C-methyltransferase / precorrin-2 dehydrogenase / sirohydrochlorin ferrochelatase